MRNENQKKSVRMSLYFSGISLMLSIFMLFSTTFAWFSDFIGSDNNTIVSGNIEFAADFCRAKISEITYLDTDGELQNLYIGKGMDAISETNKWQGLQQNSVIAEEYFEANKSGARYIRIKNMGNIPCDVTVNIVFRNAVYDEKLDAYTYTDDKNVAVLSEVIKADIQYIGNTKDSKFYSEGEAPIKEEWAKIKTLDIAGVNGVISWDSREDFPNGFLKDDEILLRVDYLMCPWAGSEYMDKTIVATFNVIAIQYNDFGFFDDPDDKFNMSKTIGSLEDLKDALKVLAEYPGMTWQFTNSVTLTPEWIADNDLTNYLVIPYPVNIDLGGYVFDLSKIDGLKFCFEKHDDKPSAMEIVNGTLIADEIVFLNDDDNEDYEIVINLTDTLFTNAEIDTNGFEKIHDNHKKIPVS
jgi:hypothetical protein